MKKIFFLCSVFFVCSVHVYAAGVTYPMASTTTWHIRFDGPSDGATSTTASALSYTSIATADINDDGDEDLIVGAFHADPETKSEAGSIYIIDHNIFGSLTGTGNVLDLNDSANYTIRYDGVMAGDTFGRSVKVADITGDGALDIIVAAYGTDNNSRNNSGSVYVIANDLILDHYGDTGVSVDLSNTTNWSIRYDGAVTGGSLSTVFIDDLNNNTDSDLVLVEPQSNYVFIIYDSLIQGYSGTGNIVDLAATSSWNIRYTKTGTPNIDYDAIYIADIDNDTKNDLLIGAPDAFVGSLYVIYNTLLDDYLGTGNMVSLSTSSNWNLRYDGDLYLGQNGALATGDINSNNKTDILIADAGNNNPLPYSGTVYLVFDDLIDDYSGTGNVINLTVSTSSTFRIRGAVAGNVGIFSWHHVGGSHYAIADIDNDEKDDVILNDINNPGFSIADPGTVYVIHNDFFISDMWDAVGNTIDLSNSNNWKMKFIGEGASDWLGGDALLASDLNADGGRDLILGAWGADFSDSGSGSLYIVYQFPQEIIFDDTFRHFASGNTFDFSGVISATSTLGTIANVQYARVGTYAGSWSNCDPIDGTFDSRSEAFVCVVSGVSTTTTVYVRAITSDDVYTPIASYQHDVFDVGTPFSDVDASAGSGDDEMVITWNTEADATTQVQYGPTTSYGSITTETDLLGVTSHSVTLSGLESCMEYHYKVISADTADNYATSSDYMFTSTCPSQRSGHASRRRVPQTTTEQVSTSTTIIENTGGCFTNPLEYRFLQDLRRGMVGEVVRQLQQVLNTNSQTMLASDTNPGAPGYETTYFGEKTFSAVKALQQLCAQNILIPLGLSSPTGYVGTRTRAVLNNTVQ